MALRDAAADEMVLVAILFGTGAAKRATMESLAARLATDARRALVEPLHEEADEWMRLEYRLEKSAVAHGMAWRVLVHADLDDDPSLVAHVTLPIDVPVLLLPRPRVDLAETVAWLGEQLRQPLPEWPGVVVGGKVPRATKGWAQAELDGLLDVLEEACAPKALAAIARTNAIDAATDAILEPVTSLADDLRALAAIGRESAEAGAAALELAREALADGEPTDAARLAREALDAGVGEVDARLVLVEALVATDGPAAAKAIDETLDAWLAPDPRAVPVAAWDALVALVAQAGSARAKKRAAAARKKVAAAGDDFF